MGMAESNLYVLTVLIIDATLRDQGRNLYNQVATH